jgi:hypothetical protein
MSATLKRLCSISRPKKSLKRNHTLKVAIGRADGSEPQMKHAQYSVAHPKKEVSTVMTASSPLRISAPSKRVCFWGAPVNSELPSKNLLEQLAASGANTGNMFIGHGLFDSLDCLEKRYHPGFHLLPAEEFQDHFDWLFVPASNFLNLSSDFEAHYEYFSRTKVPILCFGLGSQLLPGQEIAIKPGTEKLIRLFAERSQSIGVRGAYTAEILQKMGIRNVTVTGCPSLLGFGKSDLSRLLANRPSLNKIAVNFSNNVRAHSTNPLSLTLTENDLFRRVTGLNSFYILQNEVPEIEVTAAISDGSAGSVIAALERARLAFGISQPDDATDDFLKWRTRIFFSVSRWISCMATMTASVGSRFHGNIAALLAGTPALFLTHDMRTRELCELLSVPHVNLGRVFSSEEILERLTSCDYTEFAKNFPWLQTRWKEFLNTNDLETPGDPDTSGTLERLGISSSAVE